MRFAFATTLAAAFAVLSVQANIRAFSGSSCNGAAGNSVLCDGSCHAFDDRHSFRVDSGSGNHCVTMFIDPGCPNNRETTGRRYTFTEQNGQCQNVNTGTNIRSFKCSNSNICLV